MIRDLVVDMTRFFDHYHAIKPYVISDEPPPERERLQTPAERTELDGLHECILCACCTGFCPSSLVEPGSVPGSGALLQAMGFIADSRDRATAERLEFLDDAYRLFRCRSIMDCTKVCPKGLNPNRAIDRKRVRMLKRAY